MKTLRIPWREILFFGATIGSFTTPGFAQSDGLVVGNQWVDMLDPGTQPTPALISATLPTGVGLYRYNGATAVNSQLVRTNGLGQLLFFAIDGNIYDCEGYMIAGAAGTTNCRECLDPGEMEMLAVPVPGSCNLFYLFTSNASTADPTAPTSRADSRVQVTLVDMMAPNYYWPERRGRVLEIFGDEVQVGHPELADLVNNVVTATNSSTFPAWLTSSDYTPRSSSPLLRIIDPTGTGQTYFLYHILKDRVFPYKITSSGIYPVTTLFPQGILTYTNNDPQGNKSWTRDADVAMGPNGEIMLAMTDESLTPRTSPSIPGTQSAQLLVMRFNATTGAYQNVTGYTFEGADPNLPVFLLEAISKIVIA